MIGRTVATIRQWRYPREFRIAPPRWPDDVLAAWRSAPAVDPAPPGPAPDASGHDVKVLAAVATGLWRMRRRMVAPGSDEPLAEMRAAYRHLESTWAALEQAGVEIQDPLGTPFDSGLSLRVVAFEPAPGIAREQVIETIRPSVYLDGQHVQVGEVIVGTPEEGESEPVSHNP